MNEQQLEERLAGLKEKALPELPDQVKARMENTYRMIGGQAGTGLEATDLHGEAETARVHRKQHTWLSRILISAASAAAVLVLVISLGFVSPAMAETLKKLPFLDSVFRLAGDTGLQKANEAGLTSEIRHSVTHGGITLTVSEQMYDGSRLSLVLTRSQGVYAHESFSDTWVIPDPETGQRNEIEFFVDGELVNTAWGVAPGGLEAPDSVIVTTLNSGNLQVPDQFDFKMRVYIPEEAEPFIFEFPVSKHTLEGFVLTPDEIKVHDHIRLQIKRLEVSRTTTMLEAEVIGEPGAGIQALEAAIPEKYKVNGHFALGIELTDEQGREVQMISGNGTGGGDILSYSFGFEPFETTPEYIVIKPYTGKEGGLKAYIPELEITVPVK